MPRLFTKVRQDTCIFCGKNRAIELYDRNNNPVRFTFILDSGRTNLLDIREIYYGECKCCHKTFSLDWTHNDKIPVPLLDVNKNNYIKQYSKSKIV